VKAAARRRIERARDVACQACAAPTAAVLRARKVDSDSVFLQRIFSCDVRWQSWDRKRRIPRHSILISRYVHFQVSNFERGVAVARLDVGRLAEQVQASNFEQGVAAP
jgi:hypothetical protein